MQLQSKAPSLEAYYSDLAMLLASKHTHFYIDTSFLIWLTKLGATARSEFFDWVTKLGWERFHVPLWASHEYHQHFIASTAAASIKESIKKLNDAAEEFYSDLFPAIAEASDPPRMTSDQIKADARHAILNLRKIGDLLQKWTSSTIAENYAEVITFINRHCMTSGRTFKYFDTIGQTTDNRFSGRVPPGFEDRAKKDTSELGGNRAGDLMFWKEILDHTRIANRFPRRKIRSIVVLTKDRKNDWVMGGKSVTSDRSIDALQNVRLDWSKISIIHPMLEHEAQVYSKVHRVALMSECALGAHFLATGVAQKFVEISVSTEMPKFENGAMILRKFEKNRKSAANEDPTVDPAEGAPLQKTEPKAEAIAEEPNSQPLNLPEKSGSSELDVPLITPLQILENATLAPQKKIANINPVISEIFSLDGATKPIEHWLLDDNSTNEQATKLLWLTRTLSQKAILNDSNASQRVIDTISILTTIDARAAASLYAGLLFGVYFDEENQPRGGARPQFLQRIFEIKGERFAEPGIKALTTAFSNSSEQPPYLPAPGNTPIEAEAQIRAGKTTLTALFIGGVDYLIPVGKEDARSLFALLGLKEGGPKAPSASTHDIILAAARTLGFPIPQLRVKGDLGRQISIASTNGINITIDED